jgi:hypothetical protein
LPCAASKASAICFAIASASSTSLKPALYIAIIDSLFFEAVNRRDVRMVQ